MKRKVLIGAGIVLVILIAGAIVIFYPMIRVFTETEVIQLDKNLTLILGGGSNSGIISGDSVVVVIDTKMMGNSEELYKLAKENAGQKPIIVINTHFHPDHVKGNKFFKGSKIYIGDYGKEYLQKYIEQENQPTDFVKDSLLLDIGNEKLHLYNFGQAHSLNDLVVYLENQKVLFTGDLVFNRVNPVLTKNETNVDKWITALDLSLSRWGDSRVIPGHGKIGDRKMVEEMRQYFIDMTTAAIDPAKEYQVKEKYKDWMKILGMTSPEKTIEHIRMSERNK
jgi:glyoxylase-like metal-dependent hydrolase (beta-lactamase superfamily II)